MSETTEPTEVTADFSFDENLATNFGEDFATDSRPAISNTPCESCSSGPLELDNTKRHCFVECRRKYYLQYVLHLKTFFGSNALRYGLVWHAGMDAYYGTVQEGGWEAAHSGQAMTAAFEAMQREWAEASAKETFYNDYRTLENCCQSFVEYMNHFAGDCHTLQVVSTEQPFKIHMTPENDEERSLFARLEDFFFTGKVDMDILLSGRPWINEHKTTGQPIDSQVQKLNRSAQVMGYFYASRRMGGNPEGVLMTVHHLSARKSTAAGKEGTYGKPKIDFRRAPMIFSENDIYQWRRSFMAIALDIQQELERGLWPMNHDSCFNYGNCPFLSICEQNANIQDMFIDPQRYYVAEPWEVAKSITASGIIY